MNEDDDLLMASLLGEMPRTPDPGFRFDVLARVGERARRRRARDRALNQVAIFSAIGVVFPVLQALGVTWQGVEPIALAAGLLAAAFVFAMLTIQGPKTALARAQHALDKMTI